MSEGALAGTSVEIPAGALSETVMITVEAGSGVDAGANTSGVGPAVRLGPAGTSFSSAVSVTLPYSTSQAGGADVMVAQRNDATGAVTIHSSPIVSGGRATVQVSGFSTFQAFVETEEADPATYDANGTWVVVATDSYTDPAGDEDNEFAGLVNIVQTGSAVSMSIGGESWTGTVSGAEYNLSGEFTEGGETTTDTVSFTLASANDGSGSITWVSVGGEGTRTGGETLTFMRQMSATYNAAGSWSLTLSDNVTIPAGNEEADETIPFTVTQAGDTFTWSVDQPPRSGFISGANYFSVWEEEDQDGSVSEVLLRFTLSSMDAGAGSLSSKTEETDGSIIFSNWTATLARSSGQ